MNPDLTQRLAHEIGRIRTVLGGRRFTVFVKNTGVFYSRLYTSPTEKVVFLSFLKDKFEFDGVSVMSHDSIKSHLQVYAVGNNQVFNLDVFNATS